MNVENAANILAGSILTGLAFVIMVITVVVINNIISKYWKPVKLFTPDSWVAINPPARYATEEEIAKIAPKLDEAQAEKGKQQQKG